MSETDNKKLLQVVKGWKEGGQVLQPGMHIEIDKRRARVMIATGYAVEVNVDTPYEYPADKPEYKFQPVKFDDEVEVKKPVIAEKPKVKESEGLAKETKPEPPIDMSKVPALADVTANYLLKGLKKAGIETLADLKGWTIEKLCGIEKINRQAAERLIDAYTKHIVCQGKSVVFNKMAQVEDKITDEEDELAADKRSDATNMIKVDEKDMQFVDD